MKLLLIEDEPGLAQPLIKALQRRNFTIDWEIDGKKGLDLALINQYDCFIIDINLPSINGLVISQKLRENGIVNPILILTARSSQIDKIKGFENGIDDYVTKPFDLQELILRIQALIRRNSINKNTELEFKDWKLDLNKQIVFYKQKEVELSKKEFSILEYLFRNKGKIITAEEILEHVWDREVNVFTQTVKTHIKTLRQKIDPKKTLIITIRGSGYIIK